MTFVVERVEPIIKRFEADLAVKYVQAKVVSISDYEVFELQRSDGSRFDFEVSGLECMRLNNSQLKALIRGRIESKIKSLTP